MQRFLLFILTLFMILMPALAEARGGTTSSGGARPSVSASARPSISASSVSRPTVSTPTRSGTISSGANRPTVNSGTTPSKTYRSGSAGYSGGVTSRPVGRPTYGGSAGYSGGVTSHAVSFGAGTLFGSMLHPTGYAYVPAGGMAPVSVGSSIFGMLLDAIFSVLFFGFIIWFIIRIFRTSRR